MMDDGLLRSTFFPLRRYDYVILALAPRPIPDSRFLWILRSCEGGHRRDGKAECASCI